MELKRNKVRFMHKSCFLYYFSVFFFSLGALFSTISCRSTTCLDISCRLAVKTDHLSFQDQIENNAGFLGRQQEAISSARRLLSGPGSSPPRCTSKCGKCTPCKPVHVPVPPGTPVTAEYYPEAWRCKCGNKLYMP